LKYYKGLVVKMRQIHKLEQELAEELIREYA